MKSGRIAGLVATAGAVLATLAGCEPECEIPDSGTAIVESDTSLRFQIDAVGTNAVDELYLLRPRYVVLTEDAAQDIGATVELGAFETCDELVFLLRSSVDAFEDHDSETSDAFRFTRTEPNGWTIEIEDYEDATYDDVVAHVFPA